MELLLTEQCLTVQKVIFRAVILVWFFSSCNQCGRSSALPSRFYELELNIQGHKNLTECVTEFLKVAFIPYHTGCPDMSSSKSYLG